jgi:hypothetical protein
MKTMKLVLVFLLLSLNLHLLAQYEYPEEQDSTAVKHKKGKYANSKIFLGGNFGLWFGSVTSIELSPIVGYMISPRLAAGGGPIYMYYKENDLGTNRYGGRVFGQFTLLKDLSKKININIGDIFIYAENDYLNIDPLYYDINTGVYFFLKDNRKWIDFSLIGFGMKYSLGQKAGVSISFLWDITQNAYFAYQNPVIRLGFYF